jgi:hypothetical protein
MRKTVLIICLSLIGFLLEAAEASAYLQTISNDAELIALQDNGLFTKYFGGNVRWGNNALNGDWEYAVVNGSDIPIGTPGQMVWTGNSPHSYSFIYDANSDSASLQVVDTSSMHSGSVGQWDVNAIVIRARADAIGGDVASLADPIIIQFAMGGSVIINGLVGDNDANSVLLVDNRLSGGFTMSGLASLTDGRGSLPMYQVKVGYSPVPLPAAFWLFGSGLAVLAGVRSRTGRRFLK